jgi:hypothetical protein
LQAKPPQQMAKPLTAIEQAARIRQLQAQTEAVRAQTEAIRANDEAMRAARSTETTEADGTHPNGSLWLDLSPLTRTALAAGLLGGASGLSWRIYATDDTVSAADAARHIATISQALNGVSAAQLEAGPVGSISGRALASASGAEGRRLWRNALTRCRKGSRGATCRFW